MFTWICPQCGKEVPPHETECPYCAEQAKAVQSEAAPPPQQAPVAVETQPRPPIPQPVPPPPQAPRQQPTQYAVAVQRGAPGWLIALLVAAGLCAVAGGIYYLVNRSRTAAQSQAQANPFEKVPAAGSVTGSGTMSKFIEVTGFRITEDQQKRLQVQFLVVNHSAADIGDLAGTVHLKTTETKPGDKPLASFDFKTTRLGPYESVEFKVITSTGLRAYELPDWQFLRADVEVTSPAGL
jgi:hypothetical protein